MGEGRGNGSSPVKSSYFSWTEMQQRAQTDWMIGWMEEEYALVVWDENETGRKMVVQDKAEGYECNLPGSKHPVLPKMFAEVGANRDKRAIICLQCIKMGSFFAYNRHFIPHYIFHGPFSAF